MSIIPKAKRIVPDALARMKPSTLRRQQEDYADGRSKRFADMVFTEGNPILVSPNGTEYELAVADDGAISTSAA